MGNFFVALLTFLSSLFFFWFLSLCFFFFCSALKKGGIEPTGDKTYQVGNLRWNCSWFFTTLRGFLKHRVSPDLFQKAAFCSWCNPDCMNWCPLSEESLSNRVSTLCRVLCRQWFARFPRLGPSSCHFSPSLSSVFPLSAFLVINASFFSLTWHCLNIRTFSC